MVVTLAAVDVAFERLVLDSVGRILLDDHDRRKAAAGLVAISARLPEIPKVVFKHKVTTIAAANAEVLAFSPDQSAAAAARKLTELLRGDYEAALAHRSLLEGELRHLVDVLGESAVVLKGFCNARFYPDGYVRWMRDIDLMCASWDDAVELLEHLLARGYEYDGDESPWVKADADRGRPLYGQIFLIRPAGSDFYRVDIHYGTYSVGYSGYLDLAVADSSTTVDVVGCQVRVFKPETCLLIAQSHALSDGYVAIKDVNDFVAIATSGQPVDWAAAARKLRAHQLGPQAALLARHIRTLYTDQRVLSAADAVLATVAIGKRTLWQTHNRSWTLRAVVNTSFAYRWHRRRGDFAAVAAWRAVQCFAFYIRRLKLDVRARSPRERLLRRIMPQPDLPRWRLRPDACTLLIDTAVVEALVGSGGSRSVEDFSVSDAPVAGIRVLSRAGFDILDVRGRLFVPTLDLLIPPAHAAALPSPA